MSDRSVLRENTVPPTDVVQLRLVSDPVAVAGSFPRSLIVEDPTLNNNFGLSSFIPDGNTDQFASNRGVQGASSLPATIAHQSSETPDSAVRSRSGAKTIVKPKIRITESRINYWDRLAYSLDRDSGEFKNSPDRGVWLIENLGILCLLRDWWTLYNPDHSRELQELMQCAGTKGYRTLTRQTHRGSVDQSGPTYAALLEAPETEVVWITAAWHAIAYRVASERGSVVRDEYGLIPGLDPAPEDVEPIGTLGKCLTLLPEKRVCLRVHDGDGERFRSLFLETWSRIPRGARASILRYWADSYSPHVAMSPAIEYVRGWMGKGAEVLALCCHDGHGLRFRSTAFDAMPDDVARFVIAHEFGHVLQSTRGIRGIGVSQEGDPINVGPDGELFGCCGQDFEIEADVSDIISWWDFDSEPFERWSHERG
jgi:hypothetical protein